MSVFKVVWTPPNPEAPSIDTGERVVTFDAAQDIARKLNKATQNSQGTYEVEFVYYMNVHTGSVDTYDGWNYINVGGEDMVNAVERDEVVEVVKDNKGWKEV